MDLPGGSLFQGAGSIQLNTSAQRQQEEEELADRKLRNEEIQNKLQDAFDDLSDDGDDTFGSNSNYLHTSEGQAYYSDRLPVGVVADLSNNNETHNRLIMEMNQLKNALESGKRETNHLNDLLQESKSQVNEMKKRLAVSEAEKERAHMTRQQTHELLVESKKKVSEQEETILSFKSKMKTLEASKYDLVKEMEHTRTLLADTQMKYHMVERNAGFSANKQIDAVLKQAQERHSAQVDMMQQQIDGLRSSLDDKEGELKTLDTRYKELQRSREALLVEKSETINQLSKSLDDSQRQCQKLMSKGDLTKENIHLRTTVDGLQRQTEDMQKTISNLTHRLDVANSNGDLLNTLDSTANFKRKVNLLGSSTPLAATETTDDQIVHLKMELSRCVTGNREKREEIKRLEEQLEVKDVEIKRLKDDENNALVQMMAHREESSKLTIRLKHLQAELDHVLNSPRSDQNADDVMDELRKVENEKKQLETFCDELKQDMKNLQSDYDSLQSNYEQTKSLQEKFMEKYQQSEVELNEIMDKLANSCDKSELDAIRLELEKQTFRLNDATQESSRFKNLYVDACSTRDQVAKELADIRKLDLQRELYVQKEKVTSLERALDATEVKCGELKKMLENEKIAHDKEMQEIKDKFETEKSNTESKNASLSSCTKCINQITEIAKFEIENLQLHNTCTNYLKEIAELRQSVDKYKTIVADLESKIVVKQEHDQLLADLKQKAIQFEDYIRNQQSPSSREATSSPKRTKSDQSSATSPSLEPMNRENEMKMRQESARILATEIKKVEDHYRSQINEYIIKIKAVQDDLEMLNDQYEISVAEVNILKEALVLERNKMNQLINKKDIQHQQSLEECRKNLDAKQETIKELENRVESLQDSMDDAKDKVQRHDNGLEQCRMALDVAEKRVKLSSIENEALQKKYSKCQEKCTNLYQSLGKYSEDLESAISSYKMWKKECEYLKIQYEKRNAEYRQLHDEYEQKQVRLEQLRSENVKLKDDLCSCRKELESLKVDQKKCSSRLRTTSSSRSNNESTMKRIVDLELEKESLMSKLQISESKVKQLENKQKRWNGLFELTKKQMMDVNTKYVEALKKSEYYKRSADDQKEHFDQELDRMRIALRNIAKNCAWDS